MNTEKGKASSRRGTKKSVTVKVRCVQCKATKEVGPGDVPQGEMPMCDLCYGPMVAVGARLALRQRE